MGKSGAKRSPQLRAGTLQGEVERLASEMPRLALAELLPRKLEVVGVEPTPQLIEALSTHLLNGSGEKFSWDDGPTEAALNVTLKFNDEDLTEIDTFLDRFAERFPDVLEEASREAAKLLLGTLTERWPEESALQRADTEGFRSRLEQRWGKAFESLRMLLTICREIGSEAHAAPVKGKERIRHGVLVRLHARGCQIAGEIMALMENGYADAAMGRWRTLYEVNVVAALIAKWGADAAERYVAHEIVESKKGMDDYERCAPVLGYPAPSEREKGAMLRQYEQARAKYGKEFLSAYGWAGAFMSNKEPKFSHLEIAAQQTAMRSFYRMASHPVHAGPKAITFQLGVLGNRSTILAGASNAGFADPSERTAVSLVQLTMLLMDPSEVLDDLVALWCLVDLRDQIVRDIMAAHHTLVREEHAYQNGKRALGNRHKRTSTKRTGAPRRTQR